MLLRRYKQSDCIEIVQLFYDTIHSVNTIDYTESQLAVWAPKVDEIDLLAWDKSLSEHYTIVVENNNIIVGFGDIDSNGYLDRLFVHKDFQQQGIASKICNELERYAKDKEFLFITTQASITAKPFFQNYGYQILKEQHIERNGQFLTNYLMRKKLIK